MLILDISADKYTRHHQYRSRRNRERTAWTLEICSCGLKHVSIVRSERSVAHLDAQDAESWVPLHLGLNEILGGEF